MSDLNAPAREADKVVRPPYAPYPTFRNFIERMKSTGLPHRIDKSVLSNLSGAAQSHLLMTLRFLKLVESDDSPTKALTELVEAFGTDKWSPTVLKIITPAYAPILNGLDMSKVTMGHLSELFRDRGHTEGTVTDKAIRFHLKALEEAGVKYSNHLVRKRGPRGATRRRRAEPEGTNASHNGTTETHDKPAEGMISFPIHLPGKTAGAITVPKDIDEDEVELVEAAIQYLRLYAKRNAGGKLNERSAKEKS